MLDSLINGVLRSDWIVLLIVGAILIFASELGFRIGRRHTPERRKAHKGQSGTL